MGCARLIWNAKVDEERDHRIFANKYYQQGLTNSLCNRFYGLVCLEKADLCVQYALTFDLTPWVPSPPFAKKVFMSASSRTSHASTSSETSHDQYASSRQSATMLSLPDKRLSLLVTWLVVMHMLIIIASNYLVQLPIDLFGFHSTWGAFSFPIIFLVTDLTVRLIGKHQARQVIARVMLPALLASYVVSVLFQQGQFNGFESLTTFNLFVFRIAFASFAAYVLGQLLDIQIFDRMRRQFAQWWIAPAAAALFGQALDTLVFFAVAFWRSSDAFMAENWIEIAFVDYVIKLMVSLLLFVPMYGAALSAITRVAQRREINAVHG